MIAARVIIADSMKAAITWKLLIIGFVVAHLGGEAKQSGIPHILRCLRWAVWDQLA
jgi:hypothetical protein